MSFGQTRLIPKLSESANLAAARAARAASYIRLYNVARQVLRMLMHVKPDIA